MSVGIDDVQHLWGWDDIHEHLSNLQGLVITRNYRTIIELGVRSGVSTAVFLEALRGIDGHLWSVDVTREHVWAPLFDDERWTFIEGADLDIGVVAQLPDQADLIFVDTDHRYELTKAEIDMYAPKVRPGGALVFHDTEVEVFPHHGGGEPPYPVRTAVMEKLPSHPRIVFDNCNGLIVVEM